MELAQKYWYIVVGAVVLMFFLSRRSSGVNVQQIGGADSNTLALAQLASSERDADENRKVGLISTVLNYDLANKNLGQQIDLANISATAQTKALENQFLLAQLSANLQSNQYAQQFSLQQQAIRAASGQQTRNDWLGAITTGFQTVAPYLFGQQTSGGGFRLPSISTPPIFGNGGGNWQDWF